MLKVAHACSVDKTLKAIFMKFGTPIDIHDLIAYAHFGGDRSRVGGQIFPFTVGLSGRPYNTRTTARVCNK